VANRQYAPRHRSERPHNLQLYIASAFTFCVIMKLLNLAAHFLLALLSYILVDFRFAGTKTCGDSRANQRRSSETSTETHHSHPPASSTMALNRSLVAGQRQACRRYVQPTVAGI